MSRLNLSAVTTPGTPASGHAEVFYDSADKRLKAIDELGIVHYLSNGDLDRNYLINGGFDVAQRQVPTTLTSYGATADRVYAFDRWALSVQTSSLQAQQVSTLATPEVGLQAPNYLKLKQITGAGKFILSQVLEAVDGASLRGRTVRVQFWAKYSVAGAMTVRFGVIENANAATADTIVNPWTTAWGANATDPTLGANLAKVAPVLVENASIAGNACTAVLTNAWRRYSATFVLPTNSKNYVVAIWSDSQLAVNDEFNVSQAGLYDGAEVKDWMIDNPAQVLESCQRFYSKTFPQLTAPAQNAGVSGALRGMVAIAGAVTTSSTIQWRFPVPMRVAPTLTFYNPSAANALARNVPAATDGSATTAANTTADCTDVNVTGQSAWTVGQELKVHAQAVAEI